MARRTKEEAQQTRAALLDAAEILFQEKGVSRTSLAAIARHAGLTRGALYWHFRNKDDLFTAMMDRVAQPFSAELEELIDRHNDPLPAWLNHVQGGLRKITRDPQTQRVMQIAMQKIEHVPGMELWRDHHARLRRVNVAGDTRIFERSAAARGLTLNALPAELAQGAHGLLVGLIYNWLLARDFDLESVGMTCIHTYLAGMGFSIPDRDPPKAQ